MSTLQDIKPKKVIVNINGKEKELKFNLNAYAAVEDHLCIPIPNALALLDSGSLKAVRAFLWAGLLHQDNNVTIEEVGNIENFEGIMEPLSEAIEISLPRSNEDE